jgi:hypothetical protein
LIALACVTASNGAGLGTVDRGCSELILYFSRGSGQTLADDPRGLAEPGLQLFEALSEKYGDNVASFSNGYLAVSVRLQLFAKVLPKLPTVSKYFASVKNGVQTAERNIADLARLCPQSKFVVAGYSQGAQVTREAVAALPAALDSHIAAVLLFGDPYFDPNDLSVVPSGGFDKGHDGMLRHWPIPRAPGFPSGLKAAVFSWCHARDPVCQGLRYLRLRNPYHGNYRDDVPAAVDSVVKRVPIHSAGTVKTMSYRVVGTCGRSTCNCRTGTCAVATWSGPGTASFRRVGAVYEGETLVIVCQAVGQQITGPNGRGSDIWDELSVGGFVSDYYVNTPDVDRYSPGIPRCQGLKTSGA